MIMLREAQLRVLGERVLCSSRKMQAEAKEVGDRMRSGPSNKCCELLISIRSV